MKNKKVLIAVFGFIIIALGVGVTVLMLNQKQEVRSHAQVSDTSTCQPPGAVTNVKVDFPSCQGTSCDVTSADCTWDAVTGAVTYQYKITEVDSGTVVKND